MDFFDENKIFHGWKRNFQICISNFGFTSAMETRKFEHVSVEQLAQFFLNLPMHSKLKFEKKCDLLRPYCLSRRSISEGPCGMKEKFQTTFVLVFLRNNRVTTCAYIATLLIALFFFILSPLLPGLKRLLSGIFFREIISRMETSKICAFFWW